MDIVCMSQGALACGYGSGAPVTWRAGRGREVGRQVYSPFRIGGLARYNM